MKNKNQSKLVEEYLLNRMTKEDETQFKTSIVGDEELLAEIEFQKTLFSVYNDEEFNAIYSVIKDQPVFSYHKCDKLSNQKEYSLITKLNNSSRFFKRYLTI